VEKLWIANLPPDASDDDLRTFVAKYAPDAECTRVERVEGDGSRPAAMLTFPATAFGTAGKLAQRLNGMFWKGRTLSASTMAR
jgi:hypothetical protein